MRIEQYDGPREFRANIECTDHNRNTWYYPNREVTIKSSGTLYIALAPMVRLYLVDMDDVWECQYGYPWKISFADTGEGLTP